MSLIQILLVFSTLLGIWVYFSFFKSVTRNRNLLLTMSSTALYFVIRPNDLSIVANFLGVGRGTDFLFYLSLLIGFFGILSLNAKITLLERDRTKLVREIALIEERLSRASKSL